MPDTGLLGHLPTSSGCTGSGAKWRSAVAVLDPASAERPATAAGELYDARRGVCYAKPLLRGWLHLLWFEASLVLGTLLLVRVHGTTRITAAAVYAASVSGLFGAS